MQKYAIVEKRVGETPLQALEIYRSKHPEFENIPMAYAGRLDPMASGKLLILIGEECKRQEKYFALDKEYTFSILFGASSDTGDILGRISADTPPKIEEVGLKKTLVDLRGTITLPYPHFSSKTVQGKPLHTWTLEGRLDEIEIPEYTATIHSLTLSRLYTKTGAEIAETALKNIEKLASVSEESKALGKDFRRADVRKDWESFSTIRHDQSYPIADITCTCSSGLYMRTLAEEIAKKMNTTGLALNIHRTRIGKHLFGPFWLRP